jgi:hypothetical protein
MANLQKFNINFFAYKNFSNMDFRHRKISHFFPGLGAEGGDEIKGSKAYLSAASLHDMHAVRVSGSHLMVLLCSVAMILFNANSLQAAGVHADLVASMEGMKSQLWSFLYPVQISSVVVGAAFAVARQSIMPLGIGVGITVGSKFLESIIGKADGALI